MLNKAGGGGDLLEHRQQESRNKVMCAGLQAGPQTTLVLCQEATAEQVDGRYHPGSTSEVGNGKNAQTRISVISELNNPGIWLYIRIKPRTSISE